ncbi:MAG TPA: VIT and VWA domain-containing protein [Pirellulaceae bacterium]|jgi:Ca-activated chloride channel family protein|nr:VIT and VWA domain-containing protein [Pirellulaceae bacterium]
MTGTGLLGRTALALAALLTGFAPTALLAQGVLIEIHDGDRFRLPRPWPHPHPSPRPTPQPEPPAAYRISELSMNADVDGQVAKVQVSQTFENTGSRQIEASFCFPLPYDGAVDRMTFLVDGKEYGADLLDADKARQIYEGYVRRNQDPALLEWVGTGMFRTSVFPIPAGAKRTVTLRYTQVLRKMAGMSELVLPLSAAKYTSKPIEKVTFQVSIDSETPLRNVYSPSHEVKIKRPDDDRATVKLEEEDVVPSEDFRLMFSTSDEGVGASVLSYRPDDDEEGYFLMLLSPEIPKEHEERPRKNVIFVLDRSGSMGGKKMEQAKESLKFVLNNLREGDLFNVVAYDTEVESFAQEMQRYNEETRKEALGFVDDLSAGGSTNISGALKAAMAQVPDDDQRPTYIVFMTDGLPTAGETSENRIVEIAVDANEENARVFSMGVGFDVNSRLLDKLTVKLHGQSVYVRPDEDIEARVSTLYSRIESPALTDLKISYGREGRKAEQGKLVGQVYPKDPMDLFSGDQLVLAGRYDDGGPIAIRVKGEIDGEEKQYDFEAKLVDESKDESFAFVEKLWAVRRIGEIIDQIDLEGKNDELVDELVRLSKKHGVLTPYTSFLADDIGGIDEMALRGAASRRLESLSEVSGEGAFYGRAAKAEFKASDRASGGRLRELAQNAAPGSSGYGRGKFGGGGGFGGGIGGGAFGGQAPPASAPADAAGGIAGRPAARQPLAAGAVPAVSGPAAASPYGSSALPAEAGEADATVAPAVGGVQIVGAKTFYRRDDAWRDEKVTDDAVAKAETVERYSDRYFELARTLDRDAAKYLALEGEVLFEWEGNVYRLVDPKS